jgi:signal transduction histidine kinase
MENDNEERKEVNILIVDDVPKNIQVAANILRSEGYRMAFAQDGRSALEQVRANAFDLVLLDIMMPEMDGYAVCEELKKDPVLREIPVIFLTARSEAADVVKGFEKGAVDYVTKPFNGAELLARVRTHVELRNSREELKKANVQLKELNATKDKFFSIIAHDLRNPVQSLLMASEMLQCNYDMLNEEKRRNYIGKLHKNTELTADLLENLLNWSRSQRGKLTYKPESLDLCVLAVETIELLKEHAESKSIGVVSRIAENTEAVGDKDMVKTVIRNLVSNAVKFTPVGGEVVLSVQETDDWVEVTVSDNGVGILPEDLDTLFRIDTQKTTMGTAKEKGTGLGLILCKEFVQINKGNIRAESEPGKGSAFTFTLPVFAGGSEPFLRKKVPTPPKNL